MGNGSQAATVALPARHRDADVPGEIGHDVFLSAKFASRFAQFVVRRIEFTIHPAQFLMQEPQEIRPLLRRLLLK